MDCLWRDDDWVKLMRARWHIEDGAFDHHWASYCCSQFAVHRDAVRAYPRRFYESLLERVRSEPPVSHYSGKLYARDFEYLWHVIFTGKPVVEHQYTANDFTS